MATEDNRPADSLCFVWGAEEISKVIGRSPRVTFHLLTTGAIPAKKVGGRWVASRQKLIDFLVEAA